MKEVAVRLVVDPNPIELSKHWGLDMLQIILPDGKWHPPKSGMGYVTIQWREARLGHEIQSREVRGPALLRGLVISFDGTTTPPSVAMRAIAIAVHDYYKQIAEEATWSFPR